MDLHQKRGFQGRESAILLPGYRKKNSILRSEDLEWAIGLNRLSLDVLGLWPMSNTLVIKNVRTPLVILTILITMVLPQTLSMIRVINELQLIVDNLITYCPSFVVVLKLYILWRGQEALAPVVKSIANDWIMKRPDWEYLIMRKEAHRARIFTISGYLISLSCIAGFIFTPLFGLSYRMITNITDKGDKFLPLQTYYPYDWIQSPYFELTYASQVVAASLVSTCFFIPDNFFGVLIFHACGQFEILGYKMSTMVSTSDEFLYFNKQRFLLRMKENIVQHVHLIRTVKRIEESFNVLILGQMMSMTCNICCLGFDIASALKHKGENAPFTQMTVLLFTLVGLMLHMFVYCFAGETLAVQSQGVCQGAYNSAWYLLRKSDAKALIPTLMRAQYPLRISAGKFVYLSLETYCNILRSSGGYLSMLFAVSNK